MQSHMRTQGLTEYRNGDQIKTNSALDPGHMY